MHWDSHGSRLFTAITNQEDVPCSRSQPYAPRQHGGSNRPGTSASTDSSARDTSPTATAPQTTRYRRLQQLRQALVIVRNELSERLASMRSSYEVLRQRQLLLDPVRVCPRITNPDVQGSSGVSRSSPAPESDGMMVLINVDDDMSTSSHFPSTIARPTIAPTVGELGLLDSTHFYANYCSCSRASPSAHCRSADDAQHVVAHEQLATRVRCHRLCSTQRTHLLSID